MNKGRKKDHINAKDMADEGVLKIRYLLNELKQSINFASYSHLYQQSDQTNIVWYKWQNSHLKGFLNKAAAIARLSAKDLKKATQDVSASLNLTAEQTKQLEADVMNGANAVYTGAIQGHKAIVARVGAVIPPYGYEDIDREIVSKRTPPLIDEITNMIKHKPVGSYGTVKYQRGDGTDVNMSWEAYIERKVRTEIQQEISSNMQAYGYQAGQIFYLCSYYGDCAKDHADFQGKIYFDADWRDNVDDEELKKEIEAYIYQNNLMSVQAVTTQDPWLTTRPNCRHYFQFVSIEDVLGVKTKKDLNNLREDNDLNYNGSYNPEKYEKLQEQRYNERKIREFKEKTRIAELELAALPDGTDVSVLNKKKEVITGFESKVKEYQAEQRKLMKQYDNLSRDYKREQIGDIYNLGVKK